MAINKIIYGDTTLIDLTNDTIEADTMLSGVTAHGANGEQIYGTMSQVTPATEAPLMDGAAAVGTSIKYAREDHVHPYDTSRQETLVSGINIKTVNGNSLLGSGDLTVSGLPSVTEDDNGKTLKVVAGGWDVMPFSGLTDPGTLPSFSATVSGEVLTIAWNAGTLPS